MRKGFWKAILPRELAICDIVIEGYIEMKMTQRIEPRTYSVSNKHENGSILIATLIFAMIVSLVLATLLPMLLTDYRLNVRNRLLITALTVAESGVEEGFWALNHLEDLSEWTADGWTEADSGRLQLKEITISAGGSEPFTLDDGNVARIRIAIEPAFNSSRIYAEGTVLTASGTVLMTQIVELTSQLSSPFQGLIAKNQVTFNGQPQFDSYDSSVPPYSYSALQNGGDNVTIGTINVNTGSVSLGNATVRGNVVSGALDPIADGAVTGGTITGVVIGDFDMDFPDITAPDTTGWPTSF